jgi:hypothetical protein
MTEAGQSDLVERLQKDQQKFTERVDRLQEFQRQYIGRMLTSFLTNNSASLGLGVMHSGPLDLSKLKLYQQPFVFPVRDDAQNFKLKTLGEILLAMKRDRRKAHKRKRAARARCK